MGSDDDGLFVAFLSRLWYYTYAPGAFAMLEEEHIATWLVFARVDAKQEESVEAASTHSPEGATSSAMVMIPSTLSFLGTRFLSNIECGFFPLFCVGFGVGGEGGIRGKSAYIRLQESRLFRAEKKNEKDFFLLHTTRERSTRARGGGNGSLTLAMAGESGGVEFRASFEGLLRQLEHGHSTEVARHRQAGAEWKRALDEATRQLRGTDDDVSSRDRAAKLEQLQNECAALTEEVVALRAKEGEREEEVKRNHALAEQLAQARVDYADGEARWQSTADELRKSVADARAETARAIAKAKSEAARIADAMSEASALALAERDELEHRLEESEAHGERLAIRVDTLVSEIESRDERHATLAQDQVVHQKKLAQMEAAMLTERGEWQDRLRTAETAMASMSKASRRDLEEAAAARKSALDEVESLRLVQAEHATQQKAIAREADVRVSRLEAKRKEHETRAKAMEAEVEGWRLRATSLQQRLNDMEKDVLVEALGGCRHCRGASGRRIASSGAALILAASALSRSKFEADVVARVEGEARAVIEEAEAAAATLRNKLDRASNHGRHLEDQNTKLKAANAALRSELDKVSEENVTAAATAAANAARAMESAMVDAKRLHAFELLASEQQQRSVFAAREHELHEAVVAAESDTRRSRDRTKLVERELSLERHAHLADKAEWEKKAEQQLEKAREREMFEHEWSNKVKEEHRTLLQARDKAKADAQQWMDEASEAQSHNLHLIKCHEDALSKAISEKDHWQHQHNNAMQVLADAKADTQAWRTQHDVALQDAERKRSDDAELFRLSIDKVVSEAHTLREQLSSRQEDMDALCAERDALRCSWTRWKS